MSYQAVVAFFSRTGRVADRPPNLLPHAMIQAVVFCQNPPVLQNSARAKLTSRPPAEPEGCCWALAGVRRKEAIVEGGMRVAGRPAGKPAGRELGHKCCCWVLAAVRHFMAIGDVLRSLLFPLHKPRQTAILLLASAFR
jgi:hypothetical protein